MQRELHGPTTRPFGFGHGYEALLLSETGRFEYLELEYRMSAAGMCEGFRLVHPIVSVSHASGFTIIRRLDDGRQVRELITPPGLSDPESERKVIATISLSQKEYSFHSANYCQFVFFDSPGFQDVSIVYIHNSGGENIVIDKDGQPSFKISRQLVAELFRTIQADRASQNSRS